MNWKIRPSGPLAGEVSVPGDKSITHRAYIIGAIARGATTIIDPLRAEDTDNTLKAVGELGPVVEDKGSTVIVHGRGSHPLLEPENFLDLGNSGTGVRLLAGVLASMPFLSVLTGDASLRRRPMGRIAEPLRMMGARVDGRADGTLLPLVIRGGHLEGIHFTSPVASAQVKSCVLLASLRASGTTRFSEPALSRDHTERMLRAMGVEVRREGEALLVEGGQVPEAASIKVPGDISSAAFLLVAAAVVEGSDVTVRNVGINPTRTGIISLLEAMGADLVISPAEGGVEPMADIRVRGSGRLRGIVIPEEWVPSIIDELPLAAVLAARASGATRLSGAGELRVKESDRIASTVQMLTRAGIRVEEGKDGFTVHGGGKIVKGVFPSHGDHRIAMSSAVLALLAEGESTVSDTACVSTSFPTFTQLLGSLVQGSISIQPET